MNTLKAFLQPTGDDTKEVIISDRFKDENGKPVPFVIRTISQEENQALLKKMRNKNNKDIDMPAYTLELVTLSVISPNLNDKEIQDFYGVLGASKVLAKMLRIGEYARLSEEVQKLSGLDNDINKDIEEAKNE